MDKAIDIILLPDGEEKLFLKQLNSSLTRQNISFENDQCLPHLSLLMTVLSEQEISKLKNELKKITTKYLPIKLEVTSLQTKPAPENIYVTHLIIERSQKLLDLQADLVLLIQNFNLLKAKKENFYKNQAGDFAISYTNNYLKNSTAKNFKPHFTIGFGKPTKQIELPKFLEINQLKLAHLGKYCTCRELI